MTKEEKTELPEDVETRTRKYRESVAKWSEAKLRKEGVAHDVPGAETLDESTLAEALVQLYRDRIREENRLAPAIG